jgi:hypothetical protein
MVQLQHSDGRKDVQQTGGADDTLVFMINAMMSLRNDVQSESASGRYGEGAPVETQDLGENENKNHSNKYFRLVEVCSYALRDEAKDVRRGQEVMVRGTHCVTDMSNSISCSESGEATCKTSS